MKNISLLLISLFALAACSTTQLSYKIDPEISGLDKLSKQVKMVSVSVIDKQVSEKLVDAEKIEPVGGFDNVANVLKQSLIEHFKNNQFKIISNPLLADLGVELQIKILTVQVKSNLLTSEIQITSHLLLKAQKHSKSFKKLYKSEMMQELVNPISSNQITGLVNQLLSKQLSNILSSPKLINFANQD